MTLRTWVSDDGLEQAAHDDGTGRRYVSIATSSNHGAIDALVARVAARLVVDGEYPNSWSDVKVRRGHVDQILVAVDVLRRIGVAGRGSFANYVDGYVDATENQRR